MSKMKRETEDPIGEVETPSQRSLAECLDRTRRLFSRELSVEEVGIWKKLLESFPSKGIEQAFENYQREGKFFPKPKDIIERIEDWKAANRMPFESCGECMDGWLIVTSEEKKTPRGVELSYYPQYAERCQCWFQYIGKKAA